MFGNGNLFRRLAVGFFLGFLLFNCNTTVFGEGFFQINSTKGEVLLVVGEDEPKPVKANDKIPSGDARLVTLEDSSAKILFPNGKEFEVFANSMLVLAPGIDTMENACASVGGVRETTVVFLSPPDGTTVSCGSPLSVILGINTRSQVFKDLPSVVVKLIPNEKSRGPVVATLALPAHSGGGGTPNLRSYRFSIDTNNIKPGDYDLVVETVDTPIGKKVKPVWGISFERP